MYSIFNSGFLCFSANDLESEPKKLRCNTRDNIAENYHAIDLKCY